ncbi:MAG: carbohydrate kinase family protein [Pseudomonadota bacterium]
MAALICGSIAYDNIMVFKDRFRNHILPDKVHMLSVAFLVPELRREFGGCAGNIAYNLKMLGGEPLPMATVGKDFEPYKHWMDECDVTRRHITIVDTEFTAQAFITTDLDDNQITAFHPGAMNFAHLNTIEDAENVQIGIVAPDGRDGMITHATQFHEAGIPFIFDPGQGLPMYDGEDLVRFIDQATWVTVNDYEWSLMLDRTGLSEAEISSRVDALIVTKGGEGSDIMVGDRHLHIPAAPISQMQDPTGCGDAYRAGLLYGLTHDMDWEITGRIASLMGAIKAEQPGTQNHRFDRDSFSDRFKSAFAMEIGW